MDIGKLSDDVAAAPMMNVLRTLIGVHGLAAVLDAIGDEFPEYANDLHEIVESVEFAARRLKGGNRK